MVSGARFLIGDVHDRMAELPDGGYDLVITSPPFLALRSYLPDGHPLKHLEIGSEATPAAFLDVMLALTAEWGRLLAPHGSIAIEIGDTYSGSGGAGGDYSDGGLRDGQGKFDGSARRGAGRAGGADGRPTIPGRKHYTVDKAGEAWPDAKSLAMIPELYAASLAYGRNLLTGEESPAGRWRVRNFKPWIRSNPPVGALGDKERPATSYVTVATRATNRYFDLDAVRTAAQPGAYGSAGRPDHDRSGNGFRGVTQGPTHYPRTDSHPAGAPPLDWWHQVDAIIDAEIDARAGKTGQGGGAGPGRSTKLHGGAEGSTPIDKAAPTVGARGVHIRRALERGGILRTVDALDVSPKGYKGAHYAVWPMELVKLLVQEMCPHRVCTTCGQPSRRIVGEVEYRKPDGTAHRFNGDGFETNESLANRRKVTGHDNGNMTATRPTTGWSDCGHGTWRPGRILDPFAGSGTTLAVATGLGMDADGIDLDERNADLARERVGMFLTVDYGPTGRQLTIDDYPETAAL